MSTFRPLLIGVCCGAIVGAGVTAVSLTPKGAPSETGSPASQARGGQGGPGSSRGQRGRRAYTPAVEMVRTKAQNVQKTISVIGEARALRSVAITSEVTGLVETVAISPGKRVNEGDLLVQIEDDGQSIDLNRAKAQYPIARDNAARFKDLAAADAASAQEAETAFNALKTLEADLRAAEYALAQRAILAPFNGIAGLTGLEPGDYIRAGDRVTTLDDTSSVVIQFAVPQELAAYIEPQQTVTARLTSAGAVGYEGVISAVDSRIDTASRTLRVEATVDNRDNRLIPGAVFTIETVSDGAPAISVPGLAVQWDRSGAYVWRRGGDGTAERAGVSIIQRTDDIVLVEGDIAKDELIVADGADRVRAGIPLPDMKTGKNNPAPKRSNASAGAPVSSGN